MSLVTLSKLNYVASGSFDKTVSIWDAYTSQQLLKLYGHKKGIVGMDYAPDYRLLVTAGFEHDACMWSPFVSSCVFRLKGHKSSSQYTHSTYPINSIYHTLSPPPLSTHPLNQPSPLNPPSQPTLSTHPLNPPSQLTLSTHPLNPPSQPTLSTLDHRSSRAVGRLSDGTRLPGDHYR